MTPKNKWTRRCPNCGRMFPATMGLRYCTPGCKAEYHQKKREGRL